MRVNMLKSKIHRATVTEADLSYEGSITIDAKLLDAARLSEFEKVDIYNCNNGERFSTYVIPGKVGEICLNGAAARKVMKGDIVIIAAFCEVDQTEALTHKPQLVFVDGKNEIKTIKSRH
jgi:aspartate 1-decarboxylase